MKYKVTMKISYLEVGFLFDNSTEALDFAEQAKIHADEDLPVTIKLIQDEAKEEEQS